MTTLRRAGAFKKKGNKETETSGDFLINNYDCVILAIIRTLPPLK
ncbi:MAG TPA: hypothetical protein VIJ27_09975 [Mucilaginibacter sp.]